MPQRCGTLYPKATNPQLLGMRTEGKAISVSDWYRIAA